MSSFPVVSSLPSCLPRPCRTLSSREFKDGREWLLSMYISRDCDRLMQVGRGTDTGQVHEVILITIALFFVVDYLLVKVTLVVIMARGHIYLLYIRFRNQPRRGCIQDFEADSGALDSLLMFSLQYSSKDIRNAYVQFMRSSFFLLHFHSAIIASRIRLSNFDSRKACF